MYSKKSNVGMAAKALLLTAIGLGLPTGIWAQGISEEQTDTTVVFPTQNLEEHRTSGSDSQTQNRQGDLPGKQ